MNPRSKDRLTLLMSIAALLLAMSIAPLAQGISDDDDSDDGDDFAKFLPRKSHGVS